MSKECLDMTKKCEEIENLKLCHAVLSNDFSHLKKDTNEIKSDVKSILEKMNQIEGAKKASTAWGAFLGAIAGFATSFLGGHK